MEYFDLKKKQLEILLREYPDNEKVIDIEGVILDYVATTKSTLDQVFDINTNIYREVFLKKDRKLVAERILRVVIRDEEILKQLHNACRDIYPKVSAYLSEIKEVSPSSGISPNMGPEEVCGFIPQVIVWQLSDIHFGDFNLLNNEPRELAAILGKANYDFEYKPDIIIVSGDLTSRAKSKEFEKFLVFAEDLSKNIWSKVQPGRFLVIPGNHDTTWETDGKADRLNAFRSVFDDQSIVTTPFSKRKEKHFEGGKITIKWVHGADEDTPPFALVKYHDYDLEILLLVSSYYSGFVPEEIMKLLQEIKRSDLKERLENLLRLDKGALSNEYLFNLSQQLKPSKGTGIAVVHHNMHPYKAIMCPNTLGPALLETLYKKRVFLLLHGHVHMIEDLSPDRPIAEKQAFCIPCTTLTSECFIFNRGFNIHLIGEPGQKRNMATIVWQLSGTGFFGETNFSLRYGIEVSSQGFKKGKYGKICS